MLFLGNSSQLSEINKILLITTLNRSARPDGGMLLKNNTQASTFRAGFG
jgi:hypothetical protein